MLFCTYTPNSQPKYILLFMNIPPQNGKTILDLLHEQIMVQDGRKNDEDLNALQALVRQHQKTSFEFQLFFFLCLSVSLKHIFLMCPTLFNCRPHEKSYTLLWLWLYQQHRALKQHNIVQVQDDYKLFNDKETNKIQPTFFPHSHLEAFL